MSPLTYQVEYMSRPDEREHVVPAPSYAAACRLAKRKSDQHDGTAVVVALEEVEVFGEVTLRPVGHVEYVYGIRQEPEGRLKESRQ